MAVILRAVDTVTASSNLLEIRACVVCVHVLEGKHTCYCTSRYFSWKFICTPLIFVLAVNFSSLLPCFLLQSEAVLQSKQYAIQSLASVAYMINNMAMHTLELCNHQCIHLKNLESAIHNIRQVCSLLPELPSLYYSTLAIKFENNGLPSKF